MLDYLILALLVLLTVTVITGRAIKIELRHFHNHIIESQYKDTTPKPTSTYTPLEEDPELEKLYKEKVDPMETVWKTVHDIMEGDNDGR